MPGLLLTSGFLSGPFMPAGRTNDVLRFLPAQVLRFFVYCRLSHRDQLRSFAVQVVQQDGHLLVHVVGRSKGLEPAPRPPFVAEVHHPSRRGLEEFRHRASSTIEALPTPQRAVATAARAAVNESLHIAMLSDGALRQRNVAQRALSSNGPDDRGSRCSPGCFEPTARPSGTEDLLKLYAESFRRPDLPAPTTRVAQCVRVAKVLQSATKLAFL